VTITTLVTPPVCQVNSDVSNGATALHAAAEEGHARVVKLLLDAGATPTDSMQGRRLWEEGGSGGRGDGTRPPVHMIPKELCILCCGVMPQGLVL
jgi:ankyrin repeat protein